MAEHEHHEHGSELSGTQLRVRALETVLTEKGYIDPAALDLIIEAYETKIGPHTGARVVAKAWRDPAFKRALLEDGSTAVRALGHESRVGDHLVAIENTPARHNMVVCTLCSCYPWDVRVLAMQRALGYAGAWPIDASRFAQERLPPQVYLGASYYQRWALAMERNVIERGFAGADELSAGRALRTGKPLARKLTPDL